MLEESCSLAFDYTTKLWSSKTAWYWHKNKYRSVEQNRKLRNRPTHLWSVYNQGDKNIQWRKDSLFSKCSGKTGQPHVKKKKIFARVQLQQPGSARPERRGGGCRHMQRRQSLCPFFQGAGLLKIYWHKWLII